mmetsp:Transcript_10560/g.25982  ORF Transcript_10560/g.25982 Transcript_10560/m.25982 type:complete len:232 (+) Transcript_10560:687-1382(+)
MDRFGVIRTHESTHVERHDVVLGETLLVPSVRTLSLRIVHTLLLYRFELVQQFLLLVVYCLEGLAGINPRIGVLPELKELLIRHIPVHRRRAVLFAEPHALGTRDELRATVVSVLTVVGLVPRGTRGDAPSILAGEVLGPEYFGFLLLFSVGGPDGGRVRGGAFVSGLGVSDDFVCRAFGVEERRVHSEPIEGRHGSSLLTGRDGHMAISVLLPGRPGEDDRIRVLFEVIR